MLGNVIMDITTKISKATEEIDEKMNEKTENNRLREESVFKLPIEYLDESEKYIPLGNLGEINYKLKI